jgi:hypothetical protein
MDDPFDQPPPRLPLSGAQAEVLRKHLNRGTMSLDDAAVLVGLPVEELAAQFQGRRANERLSDPEGMDRTGGRRRGARHAHDDTHEGFDGGANLTAPERRVPRQGGGNTMLWAGGALAGIAVIGGLALLSGIPQSLLFAPRGVSEHKGVEAEPQVTATAPGDAVPGDAAPVVEPVPVDPGVDPGAAPAEQLPAEAPPVDPAMADPAMADPALADPNAVPPADPNVAEAPLPVAPEDVPPAVATAESDVAVAPEPPPVPAVDAAPDAFAEAPAAPGPGATFFLTRSSALRDAPASTGASKGQLKRGDAVAGAVVLGPDGKSQWLLIESGPGAGTYVSAANVSPDQRPRIVQVIGAARAITQTAAFHSGPNESSSTLDTLNPGINVFAAAEVEGGWIEVQKRAGGVGYIRKEAIE